MTFGDVLRELIEERGMTQKQVASDLNIAPSTMGGYVQNTSEPDFNTLKLLARYFNVTVDYLLDFRSKKAGTRQEDEVLRVFRSLTAEQKNLYLEQGKVFIRFNQKNTGNKK